MNDISEKYIDIMDKGINGKINETNVICRNGKIKRNTSFIPGWWYTYPSDKYESQLG